MFRKSDATAAREGPLSDPVLCGVAAGLADMFRPVPHPWDEEGDGPEGQDPGEDGGEPDFSPCFGR